ncbi:MAG: prepilin peptidase [Chloroflexi bacterium]|nr:prepilin peptidase [Chloroflexota bacterium]
MEFTILYGILGLLVGSFSNLLADLLPQHRYRLEPPRCPVCQNPYPKADWVTSISFLLGRGHCPNCGTGIPFRRPLLEISTGLGFALLWANYSNLEQRLILSVYLALLLLFLVIDLERWMVPNMLVLPAMVFAATASLFYPGMGLGRSLLGGIIGFGFFYLAAVIGRGGMGAGDVKLAGFIGLATGFPEVIVALLFSTLLGGLTALALLVTKKKGLESQFPYAPFLVLGGLTALFYGSQVVEWYLGRYT